MNAAELDMMAFVRRVGTAAVRKQATKPWPSNIVAVLAHMVIELDKRVTALERKVSDEPTET